MAGSPKNGRDAGIEEMSLNAVIAGVVSELQKFRKDPAAYAEVMLQLRECYDDKVLTFPDSGLQIETVEGVAALECCLEDLYNASPLPVLMYSQAISKACLKHLSDLGENDFCSHIGTDGSTPEERLSKFGEQREQCGENIVFSMRRPKEIVWQMLIDDGAPERGHRANLLNMDFHFVGVAHGSHPSTETVTILLLVDHFRPKKMDAFTRMQKVAEAAAGPGALEAEEKTSGWEAYTENWRKALAATRPDYMRISKGQAMSVDRLSQPVHRAKSYPAKIVTPRFPVGMLIPTASVDPSVVRGFVHRIDKDFDDLVEEAEIVELVTQHVLGITEADVTVMFEEILQRRPVQNRHRRAVDWREIYAAMKSRKEWTPVVDLAVEGVSGTAGPRAGLERYELVVEISELLRWCREVYRANRQEAKGLIDPVLNRGKKGQQPGMGSPTSPRGATATGTTPELPSSPPPTGSPPSSPIIGKQDAGQPAESGSRLQAKQLVRLNSFMQSLIEAAEKLPKLLTNTKVQEFLRRPEDVPELLQVKPRVFKKLLALNPRRLWSYHLRPHREKWLRLFGSVGMHPVLPLPTMPEELPIAARIDEQVELQKRLNLARPDKVEYTGLAPGCGGVRVLKTHGAGQRRVRSLQATDQYPVNHNRVRAQDLVQEGADPKPWEESREQVESLVNSCIESQGSAGALIGAASRTFDSSGSAGALLGEKAVASVPFGAKSAFQQALAKEQRLSEERRDICLETKAEELEQTMLLMEIEGGEPPSKKTRGTGAHPLSAISGGLLGHYHSSVTAHLHVEGAREGEYPRTFPQTRPGEKSTDIRWEGHHIDQHKDDPAVDYIKEWTGMKKEERDKFWYTGPYRLPDITDQKRVVLDGRRDIVDKWKPFKIWEFRDDHPQRWGKFGRRVFDPQVRDLPLRNAGNCCELEKKPQEEFQWQQDRMFEYLDRQLPPGQKKHFEQYLPPAQFAWKELELTNRVQMRDCMNGRSQLGARLSDYRTDFKSYARPLGVSNLDKVVPVGPALPPRRPNQVGPGYA